jgi:cellulase/cellobiase CelA1
VRGKHGASPATVSRLLHLAYARTLGALDTRARWVGAFAVVLGMLLAVAAALSLGRAPSDDWPSGAVVPLSAPSSGGAELAAPASRPATPAATRTRTEAAAAPRTPVHTHATPPQTPGSVPDGGLTARYAVSSSWDTGFVAGVTVANPTGQALSWRIVLTHAAAERVAVADFWNAALTRSGTSLIFTGGPLAPGATQTFGFEATKGVPGPVRPRSCTVNRAACVVA